MKHIIFLAMLIILLPGYSVKAQEGGKTFADLQRFLQSDNTDTFVYTDTFNCRQFSKNLVANARAAGFIVVADVMQFDADYSHEFTAFHVIDRADPVWVEPQDDSELFINGNDELCDRLGNCFTGNVIYAEYRFTP